MTTFGWKRKLGDHVSKSATSKFQEATGQRDADSCDDDEEASSQHWVNVAKQRRAGLLEDAQSKSKRLKEEGAILAEAERYWEAIKKWDEALQLTPDNENILDMKAQALLILHEVFPAVQAAEDAVRFNPRWWAAYQTLGRAQLGLGEIELAITSFSRAVHLNPDEEELWDEDLGWARSLLRDKLRMDGENTNREQEDNDSDNQEKPTQAQTELLT